MRAIKKNLNNLIKIVFGELFRLFYVFPVNKKKIFFSAYWGQKVNCNPKCIYDYIAEHCPDEFESVWTYGGKDDSVIQSLQGVKIVKQFSLAWFYARATARVVVVNYNPTLYVPVRRRGQFIVQTWHAGGAYKKVGCASSDYKIQKYVHTKTMAAVDLFVSSSEVFTRSNIVEAFHYTGDVLNSGMPRNDIFFSADKVKAADGKVRSHFGISGKILLYAPTFRGAVRSTEKLDVQVNMEELQEALTERFGEPVHILVRCHYLDQHAYTYTDDVINASDYPDMQELLCASDVLITDYSSSMWDYALLGRPCFLYVPDEEQYLRDKGVFTPVEEWPGVICRSMNELCDAVRAMDFTKSRETAKEYLLSTGSYENGHATELVCQRVIEELRK